MHTRRMKKRPTVKDWLPLSRGAPGAAEVPTGEAFKPAWIDFEKGIRVGNLEPHELITQILKHRLEEAWTSPFVTDGWGRGGYWQNMTFWVSPYRFSGDHLDLHRQIYRFA